jgi:hypothetical protein
MQPLTVGEQDDDGVPMICGVRLQQFARGDCVSRLQRGAVGVTPCALDAPEHTKRSRILVPSHWISGDAHMKRHEQARDDRRGSC